MIQLTETAVKRVQHLLQSQGKQGHHLRIYVEGGGCSGMQYGLEFDEHAREDDAQVDCEGFKVLVDSMSLPFLDGTEVDYVDTLMESGFKIRNPQAKTTCGCGQSFGV